MKPEDIITDIAAEFGVDVMALLSTSRKRLVVDAREVTCYVLHRLSGWSSTMTGITLGLNHATVLHSCKNVQTWLDNPRINPLAAKTVKKINEKYFKQQKEETK